MHELGIGFDIAILTSLTHYTRIPDQSQLI